MNRHISFYKIKTVYLQGFWKKSVYLKYFGNQFKTVYLERSALLEAIHVSQGGYEEMLTD